VHASVERYDLSGQKLVLSTRPHMETIESA